MKARVFDLDGGKMSAGIDLDLFMQNEQELHFPKVDESLPFKDFLFFRKEYSNWMLFTGLKDKNGKECYYSDVIRFYDTEGREYVHEIKWSDELCCTLIGSIPYQKLFDSGFIQPSKLEFEIIGNTFEPPSLIKGGGK